MENETSILNDKLHWYKDAVIYELHIKAFRDSNGDGIGDFAGLLEKLDYLQELGVTAIWLLPFYPSPLKDDGYDIADYYNIHTSYGNIGQFQNFLDEAHKRQLKVITELVINHTSDQHPWFQRARRAPIDSPERNYYVWSDDPGKYKDVRIIFQDYEASNWTWDPVAEQYYWHRFFHHQPDLNYDNPQVQEEIFRILDFWCKMGVDGFRLDAIPYLFEREGTNGENLPETHIFLKKLRQHVDEHYPGTVLLAEANMWPEDSASYFGDGDECHMNYHFPVMPRMFMSLQMEDQYPITDIFAQTPAIPETCQWAIFLRNHDELTLEMVTDEERDYMYKVYAKDPKARINLGIRHRLAPLMENNRRKIELMNSLLFSLPGTPVIYYGDEIGMGDNFYLGDRDGVRTPMQWSPDRNAGFSDTNPQKLYLPVILDPEYHFETVNVETQRKNTSSLFWYMKSMISVRKKYKSFSRGDLKFIQQDNPKVLAFTRSYQGETVLVVVNFSKYTQAAEINLDAFNGYHLVEVVSRNPFPAVKPETPYFFTLSAHSFHWFILEPAKQATKAHEFQPVLLLSRWEDITQNRHLERLEGNVLRSYLLDQSWFNLAARTMHSVKIVDNEMLPSESSPCLMLLIEVHYDRGLPELYQLPLAFLPAALASEMIALTPQSLIAELMVDQSTGWLCDAYYLASFHKDLWSRMKDAMANKVSGERIAFSAIPGLSKSIDEGIKSRVLAGNPSITTIDFGNRYLLKIYRKLDKGLHPDMEMSQFLDGLPEKKLVPEYKGMLDWKITNDTIHLGMISCLGERHGTGHSFMLERFNNYLERVIAAKLETVSSFTLQGTITEPVDFHELPEEIQTVLGARTAEQAKRFGKKTAALHLALASGHDNGFKPEDFSLHYQRSLFSSMQTLTRETTHQVEKSMHFLPESLKKYMSSAIALRDEILQRSKAIYRKKLDMHKVRIHGNLHLEQFVLEANEILIDDFLGHDAVSYSERKIKRSVARDLAGIIRSFHNIAYEGVTTNHLIQTEEQMQYEHASILWTHYVSGFFMKAYMEGVKNSLLLPRDKEDLEVVLSFFLLRKTMQDLKSELQQHSERAIVPLRLLNSLMTTRIRSDQD